MTSARPRRAAKRPNGTHHAGHTLGCCDRRRGAPGCWQRRGQPNEACAPAAGEKPRPGVKILMSGGTRCNLTHATDNRGIVEAYGPPGRFLHSALAALSVEATIALFEAEGVPPRWRKPARSFRSATRQPTCSTPCCVGSTQRRRARPGRAAAGFATRRRFRGDDAAASPRRRVVLTCGGRSYPGSGTTGDGYDWARSAGPYHHSSRAGPRAVHGGRSVGRGAAGYHFA